MVAIDPKTGAILALASFPSFDPNKYATLNGKQARAGRQAATSSDARPAAAQPGHQAQTFPPGSTFKVVTSSAALSEGNVASPQTTVPAPTQPEAARHQQGADQLNGDDGSNLRERPPCAIFAFTVSCNTVFGKLGMQLGRTTPCTTAGQQVRLQRHEADDPAAGVAEQLPADRQRPGVHRLLRRSASSATGSPRCRRPCSPAAIANDGTLMTPYMVHEVQAPDLTPVQTASHAAGARAGQPERGQQADPDDDHVSEQPYGTAHATAIQNVAGVAIAGKTGTAQNGVNNTKLDDAVFTCFAPASNPSDRCRRHREGRRVRRGRGGAHRGEGHPGIPARRSGDAPVTARHALAAGRGRAVPRTARRRRTPRCSGDDAGR